MSTTVRPPRTRARCARCRRRRRLTEWRTAAGERVCGSCVGDALLEHTLWIAWAELTIALTDGEPVPNAHYALRRPIAERAGWGAT